MVSGRRKQRKKDVQDLRAECTVPIRDAIVEVPDFQSQSNIRSVLYKIREQQATFCFQGAANRLFVDSVSRAQWRPMR